ncbi:MAG TPA: hypothetical protein VIX73_12595, partial [Kofleriaceae bacterium]
MTQIRPSTGYLELPAPMPVGAQIAIVAEDGLTFDAIVTAIHEQISGSDRPPGMIVAPALGAPQAAAWWTSRVALPDDEAVERQLARVVGDEQHAAAARNVLDAERAGAEVVAIQPARDPGRAAERVARQSKLVVAELVAAHDQRLGATGDVV